MRGYAGFPLAIARRVEMLILDVDGVLTDGSIVMDHCGKEIKVFNVRDGHGLKLLQRAGVKVGIITGRRSEVVAHRAADLGIQWILQGCLNKLEGLHQMLRKVELSPDTCAFMGDDVLDLPPMRVCRLGMAPSDAHPSVLKEATWVADFEGGKGAVRQAAEGIILAKGKWEEVIGMPYGIEAGSCGWPS